MINGILEILFGIIGLSIVVLVHEGGHYIAARYTGIRVETFSVGFGRRLFGFKRGETDYRISLVPLGGYCRFYGEQSFRRALDEKLDHIPGEAGEFYGSSPLRRIIVSFAGPLANFVFAIIVFTMISWIGFQENYTEPRVILVSEWSEESGLWPSDEAGLESGDYITAVDGEVIDRFYELRRLLVFRPDETISLTIRRNGRDLTLNIVPELNRESGVAIIGVLNWVEPIIDDIGSGTPAEQAGFQPDDRITTFNGLEVPHTVAFYTMLEQTGDAPATLQIERNGRILEIEVPSALTISSGLNFQVIKGRSVKLNGFRALGKGLTETFDILSSTIRGLRMLFLGIELQNAVSGPIRLISDTGAVVIEGFRSGLGPGLLWSFELMSLISVSLAFLNLLPIPVLDGGQILLFVVEIFKRRPFNPRSVYRYQFVGTIIVLLIAVAATTGDLIHLNSR